MHKKRISRIVAIIYTIVWIILVIGCTLHDSYEYEESNTAFFTLKGLTVAMVDILPLFILFAINNNILIRFLLAHDKIWLYIICATALLFAVAALQYQILTFFLPNIMGLYPGFPPGLGPGLPPRHSIIMLPPPFVHALFYDLLVIGINLATWGLARQVHYRLENIQLVEINTRSQLDQLKSQINPHFYMNMLNSIHGLVDINPEKAKALIMDLSKLMSYMLYDSSENKISLTQEIKFLKDYIRIIHERYPKGKVEIMTFFPNEEDVADVMIPPLLFIAFIENAFKHGVDYRFHSSIIISMDIFDNNLHFGCLNKLHPKNTDVIGKGGIGLENIKKRLNLIYGDRAILNIKKSQTEYIINLIIPIDETKTPSHKKC